MKSLHAATLALAVVLGAFLPSEAAVYGPANIVSTLSAVSNRPAGRVPFSVEVLGFSSPGDGFTGVYDWIPGSTATVDHGRVLGPVTATTTGRFIQRDHGVIDARAFGADPFGVRESGAPINLALASKAQAMVWVPPGNYLLSTTILLRNGCSLVGSGRRATEFIGNHEGTLITNFDPTNNRLDECYIGFFGIKTASGVSPEWAIKVDDISHSNFEQIEVRAGSGLGCENGILNYGRTRGAWANNYVNVKVNVRPGGRGFWGDSNPAFSFHGPNSCKLERSYFSTVFATQADPAFCAIEIDKCNDVRIVDCGIENYYRIGVRFGTNAQNNSVRGTRFETFGGYTGTTSTNRHFIEDFGVGNHIEDNMLTIVGSAGTLSQIYPENSRSTIIDASWGGFNQINGSLLVGSNIANRVALSSIRTFGPPIHNYIAVSSTLDNETNVVGIAHYDGTNNAKTFLVLDGPNKRAQILATSSTASIPIDMRSGNTFVGTFTPAGMRVGAAASPAAPHASTALDVVSTNGGVGLPIMTKAQRNTNIGSPRHGVVMIQTDPGNDGIRWYSTNAPGWLKADGTADP